MANLNRNQWLGLILILAAILIWAPLNFIPSKEGIGALIVVIIGVFQLFR